jgi:hypothetical protein
VTVRDKELLIATALGSIFTLLGLALYFTDCGHAAPVPSSYSGDPRPLA